MRLWLVHSRPVACPRPLRLGRSVCNTRKRKLCFRSVTPKERECFRAAVQAVQAAINACLAAATPAAPPVQKHQVWLALAPPGVHSGVWDVVCLAAVRAMDKGRRALIRETLAPPNPEDPTTPDALAARCGAAAQGHFWSSLHSFASHRRIPPGWQNHCPPTHPFLFFDPAQQLLTVHRPPGPR